jgi:1,4-dihydroxy-2-naphthoyl-CoA hydrolase
MSHQISLDETTYRPHGFDAFYGLEIDLLSPEVVTAHVTVRDELMQPYGLVHGGVYASIAESLASLGTAAGVLPDGKGAMGLSNQTNFLRPITEGVIHARAERRHAGRTTWVWEVEITDDQGRLCVLTRMTIAVRENRERRDGSGDAGRGDVGAGG